MSSLPFNPILVSPPKPFQAWPLEEAATLASTARAVTQGESRNGDISAPAAPRTTTSAFTHDSGLSLCFHTTWKIEYKEGLKGFWLLNADIALGKFSGKAKKPRKSLGREPDAHPESHKWQLVSWLPARHFPFHCLNIKQTLCKQRAVTGFSFPKLSGELAMPPERSLLSQQCCSPTRSHQGGHNRTQSRGRCSKAPARSPCTESGRCSQHQL